MLIKTAINDRLIQLIVLLKDLYIEIYVDEIVKA